MIELDNRDPDLEGAVNELLRTTMALPDEDLSAYFLIGVRWEEESHGTPEWIAHARAVQRYAATAHAVRARQEFHDLEVIDRENTRPKSD